MWLVGEAISTTAGEQPLGGSCTKAGLNSKNKTPKNKTAGLLSRTTLSWGCWSRADRPGRNWSVKAYPEQAINLDTKNLQPRPGLEVKLGQDDSCDEVCKRCSAGDCKEVVGSTPHFKLCH